MRDQKRVEILAPAGSFESMTAAVAAGADAVYMGGSRFGARAYADNPDEGRLLEAIDYVHLHGCQLYMTVNTLLKEQELDSLYDYLAPYYERGLDAVIVQDFGVLSYIRDHFPGLPIHASTQMTITGVYGAKALRELGASRVVTARELSLEEIRRIRREVPVEIESFVHGALCYCYSGQCLMSSLIGGRSGNRGRCAQPCRLPYEVKRGGKTLNKDKENYLLNLKDLCTLDLIPDLIEAGVYSMKIEGRMKSPRYTAGVVSVYRKYVDRYLEHGRKGWRVDPEDRRMLLDLFDRGGFSEGYYERHNGREMVALKEKPAFREGNQKLFDYLDRTYVQAVKQEPISGILLLEEGQPSCLTLTRGEEGGEPVCVTVMGQVPERAQNQPITEEKAAKQIGKTGGTPFRFSSLTAAVSGPVFLPLQALNELRRDGLKALEDAVLERYRREPAQDLAAGKNEAGEPAGDLSPKDGRGAEPAGDFMALDVSVETGEQLEETLKRAGKAWPRAGIREIGIDSAGIPAERWSEAAAQIRGAGCRPCLILPHIFRSEAERYFAANLGRLKEAGFGAVIVRALEEAVWLKENGVCLPMIFDDTMYAWNRRAAAAMKRFGAERITMPLELNSRELGGVYRDREDAELVVYGFLPMMVSAQCVKRTAGGCDRRPEVLKLKDRTGKLMSVKNNCTFCYNTIYNPSPLSLLGNEEEVRRLSPGQARLKFTWEDAGQTGAVLDAFLRAFGETAPAQGGSNCEIPFKDFTRGHFRRGVE